jgi:hypothetical protein
MNKKAIKKDQLYNLDYELAKIILQALKDFNKLNAKCKYAHFEQHILIDMIVGFGLMVKEGKDGKYSKLRPREQKKALKLFAENFNKLWI